MFRLNRVRHQIKQPETEGRNLEENEIHHKETLDPVGSRDVRNAAKGRDITK